MIRLKRVYNPVGSRDGKRVLVDRLWPRGLKKAQAGIDDWRKDLGPSHALRKWFDHDPAKWAEFRRRYRKELREAGKLEDLRQLARLGRRRTITLVYGAADERHNQALVLKELLDELA